MGLDPRKPPPGTTDSVLSLQGGAGTPVPATPAPGACSPQHILPLPPPLPTHPLQGKREPPHSEENVSSFFPRRHGDRTPAPGLLGVVPSPRGQGRGGSGRRSPRLSGASGRSRVPGLSIQALKPDIQGLRFQRRLSLCPQQTLHPCGSVSSVTGTEIVPTSDWRAEEGRVKTGNVPGVRAKCWTSVSCPLTPGTRGALSPARTGVTRAGLARETVSRCFSCTESLPPVRRSFPKNHHACSPLSFTGKGRELNLLNMTNTHNCPEPAMIQLGEPAKGSRAQEPRRQLPVAFLNDKVAN